MVRNSTEKEIEKIIQRTQIAIEEILGRRKTSRKDWISDDTWGRIGNCKEIKGKLLHANNEIEKTNLRRQYREANKSVKKSSEKR